MQMLAGIILISAVILFIALDIYKRSRKKKSSLSRPSNDEKQAEIDRAKRMAEFQKGNARGGGPFS